MCARPPHWHRQLENKLREDWQPDAISKIRLTKYYKYLHESRSALPAILLECLSLRLSRARQEKRKYNNMESEVAGDQCIAPISTLYS
jgi:hypothetical protein